MAILYSKVAAPTVKDLKFANKIVRNVKTSDVVISFVKLSGNIQTKTYCDASYANLPDGGSQGGQILFLSDECKHASPISWTSRKVRRVCRSTVSAETMSLLDAMDTGIWLAEILREVIGKKVNSILYNDNKSLCESAYSTTAVEEKRLRVDMAAIGENIKDRILKVQWIPKEEQVADVLTKQG